MYNIRTACRGLLAVLLILGNLFNGYSQTEDVRFKKIQSYVDSIRTANGFPGMSVTVVYQGSPRSFVTGFSNLAMQTPLKADDKMFSGSTGKMFFALLTMRLVKEGRLRLDDKIEKYLGGKSWFSGLPNGSTLTIRNLLNHTTGIEEYYPLGDFLKKLKDEPDRHWKIGELIAYALDRAPLFAAGEKFGYADTNYLVLGVILADLFKKDPFEVVSATILKPANMVHTVPSSSRKMKVATGYIAGVVFPWKGPNYDSTGLLVVNPQFEMMGGGFASTTEDMAKYVYALMKGKLIDTANLAIMKSGIAANTGRNHQYGIGLQIRPYTGGLAYGHSGWFPGYITDIDYYPAEDIAIAVQFNTDEGSKIKGARTHMLNILKILTAVN